SASGVPRHDGPSARGGLEEDVAPALHLQPAETRPARHGEDVAGRVVARQLVVAHLAGEQHAPGLRGGCYALQRVEVRPPADDQETRAGRPAPDRRHPGDQDVLSLPTNEPADADDERIVLSDAVSP